MLSVITLAAEPTHITTGQIKKQYNSLMRRHNLKLEDLQFQKEKPASQLEAQNMQKWFKTVESNMKRKDDILKDPSRIFNTEGLVFDLYLGKSPIGGKRSEIFYVSICFNILF